MNQFLPRCGRQRSLRLAGKRTRCGWNDYRAGALAGSITGALLIGSSAGSQIAPGD